MHLSVREFPMLSLEKCRQLLGDEAPQDDHDLERLRREMYVLAGVAVSAFCERKVVSGEDRFEAALRLVPADEREALDERASIREYDGGFDRGVAERSALSDYMRAFQSRR